MKQLKQFFHHISLLILLALAGCSSDTDHSSCPTCIHSAEAAAQVALLRAQEANASGTFGVGGAIIENSTGREAEPWPNYFR